jgi:hypothetical protein
MAAESDEITRPGGIRFVRETSLSGRSDYVIILELRGVQQALELKVNSLQHEFTSIADRLAALRRKWIEEEEPERPKIVAEQETLKQTQLAFADKVNIWRDRLRAIESPQSEQAQQKLLQDLLTCGEEDVVRAVKEAQRLLAMDPEEKAALLNRTSSVLATSPVGRLLERARTSYDLRNDGPAAWQRAAVEFANRTSMAQDDSALEELEAAIGQTDPIVADVAIRTLVEILRFRALRVAELEISHRAVQRLTKIKNPLVIPILIEIVGKSRTGYVKTESELKEESNNASRLIALIALVEWRTKEAQDAIRSRTFDQDLQIENAALRALEAFPGDWSGKPS